jgi:hypothetical protein
VPPRRDGPATQAITVDLTDEDDTYLNGANALGVTVNNVPPTIAISGAASIDKGVPYVLTLGAVSDPGTETVAKYVVNWGDGSSTTYTIGGDKSHVYAAGGVTRAITVDLVDEDGSYANRANALNVKVNTGPTIAVPAAQTAFEDVNKAITGIRVGNPDGGSLMVTLAVGHGTLVLATVPGLTVSGNGSRAVTLSGNSATLDDALASLNYRGSLHYRGGDRLRVTVSDGSLSLERLQFPQAVTASGREDFGWNTTNCADSSPARN